MKLWLVILAAYAAAQMAFSGYFLLRGRQLAKKPYFGRREIGSKSGPRLKVLIAGDSLGAGVGASGFEASILGRIACSLAKKHSVTLTNTSVSGSRMADLRQPEEKQDLAFIFISSNDLYHFTPLKEFEKHTKRALAAYSKLSRMVVLAGPGNIGGATAIPLILRPLYSLQRPKYAAILKRAAASHRNVRYVNPAEHKDLLKGYGRTEAADGFHPNNNGHRFWADLVLSAIKD